MEKRKEKKEGSDKLKPMADAKFGKHTMNISHTLNKIRFFFLLIQSYKREKKIQSSRVAARSVIGSCIFYTSNHRCMVLYGWVHHHQLTAVFHNCMD